MKEIKVRLTFTEEILGTSLFEKSRKEKEMKANEIYSLRKNSGESKTEIYKSRSCIYTQKNSRV